MLLALSPYLCYDKRTGLAVSVKDNPRPIFPSFFVGFGARISVMDVKYYLKTLPVRLIVFFVASVILKSGCVVCRAIFSVEIIKLRNIA